MLTKDKIKIHKLRRRLAFSYIIIFVLVVWLKNKFDDLSYYHQENTFLNYELINKEIYLKKLELKLKSEHKKKNVVIKKIPKYKKIINIEKSEKIEQKVDSSNSKIEIKIEEVDTSKNDN